MLERQLIKKTFAIGLTGGIATGKSTVAKYIVKKGFTVIDADILSREAVVKGSKALQAIETAFGSQIIKSDGTLDRQLLKQIVFTDISKLQLLESITHPEIYDLLVKKIQQYGLDTNQKPWFYEAALIFETGSFKNFRKIWVVACSLDEQIKRVTERDRLSELAAKQIISKQWPIDKKIAKADYLVISTDLSKQKVWDLLDEELEKLE